MTSEPAWQPEFHRGSCICSSYDLRISQRCLIEDLEFSVGTGFVDAVRHPIVSAFVAKRHHVPISGKTVGTECGERTLYHLGVGNDHRGATWYDAAYRVVWLCGYGLHRSGEPGDAFQKFKQLLGDDRIYPVKVDYRQLMVDREIRFFETAPDHAMALRKVAISNPGVIQTGILGRRVPVRIVANVSPGITDLTIAFSQTGLNQQQVFFIIRCFAPEPEATLPDVSDTLGGTPLVTGEIAFQIIMPA